MEYKYTITLDTTTQRRKPTKPEMGKISNSLKLLTGLTINEFATYTTSPYTYTWIGGIFSGSICNANWQSQSVIALDFDKGLITVEHILEKLNQIEIYPQVWYSTLSDSPELPKFRIVFFLDQPIKDKPVHNLIMESLLRLFPEADKVCKNASRFFLGGKLSKIINTNPIKLSKLAEILAIQTITLDHGKTRNIPKGFFETISNYVPDCTLLYNNYRNVQLKTKSANTTPTSKEGGIVIDIEVARQRIKILDSFLDGEWLYHDQLFGLATNLYYVRGGRSLMNNTMLHYNEYGNTSYTENNFSILTYLNKAKYPPLPIHSFSNFAEDKDLYDLISASKDKRGQIEVAEPIIPISLTEAENRFKNEFERVLGDPNNDTMNIFILPTAIGKTEQLTSVVGTIAATTNTLKEEVNMRMKIPTSTTPDALVFENEQLNKKLKYYYSIGLPKKATAVLYDVINEKNSKKYSTIDIQKANQYLAQLNATYQSDFTILTTHNRALHTDFKHNTIIFDEDPINVLIDIKQVRISDIQKLDNQTKLLNCDLENIVSYLKALIPSEIVPTPLFSVDIVTLVDKLTLSNIETNIFEFFNSSYLMKDSVDYDLIHYVVSRELPKNKKIIILSATLPLYIYQRLFKEKINVINIKDVEQKGEITQYTKSSCSRNSLSRYVKDISKEVGDKPTITFKSFQQHFVNPVKEMYFGNCSGYDTLKGKDIAVVGTPHRDNIQYLLTAKVLGINFKTTETTMSYQKIEYNGYKFKFNCYDNVELRNIQLALIESDLVQAVGRARTLRTDAKVELYSNFPLRITSNFIY